MLEQPLLSIVIPAYVVAFRSDPVCVKPEI